MVGIMDKTAKAAKIRAEAGGGPLSVDQKSRLMDLFATHPASTTLHAKGGAVKFRKGGMVKGKSMSCKSHVDWSK